MSRSQLCSSLSVLPDTFETGVRGAYIWVVSSTILQFPVRTPPLPVLDILHDNTRAGVSHESVLTCFLCLKRSTVHTQTVSGQVWDKSRFIWKFFYLCCSVPSRSYPVRRCTHRVPTWLVFLYFTTYTVNIKADTAGGESDISASSFLYL